MVKYDLRLLWGFVRMSIWNAVLLGLVQGVAEFLPISSSGHLSIINNLFNMSMDEGHMYIPHFKYSSLILSAEILPRNSTFP